jgi:hypothetical protein
MKLRMHTSSLAWLPSHTPFLFVDGDGSGGPAGAGDGGGGGGAADSSAATTSPSPLPNLADWTAQLEALNGSLGGKLDTLVDTVRTASTTEPASEPVDLEGLSRPELVAHIVSTLTEQITSLLDIKLQPFAQQLTNLQTDVVSRNASAEVDSLRGQHKDFTEWKDDMIALARQPTYASLGITDLYQLAKAKNPTKAAELTTKYNPPAVPVRRPSFGGLVPGAGGSAGNGAKPLSSAEAGRAAYAEVQARHSDVLPALEGL